MPNPVLFLPLGLYFAEPPPEPDLPIEIRTMLEEAMASGNDGDVATIVRYARQAAPKHSQKIADLASHYTSERSEKTTKRLRTASFGALLKGRAEIGGWINSGNTDSVGVTGVLDLSRDGYRWRQKLKLQADYQANNGVTSREHYLAAFEPNYKVDDRLYVYGATQYESDKFFGYYSRYTASTGAGYTAIAKGPVTLDVELGPAFRYTSFTQGNVERNLAARGSIDFDWRLTPALTLRQDTSAYIQAANSTVTSLTAIDAKLLGPLSARFSYNIQYESLPPVGRVNADTTGRAALVYAF
jgi:putative salt-induced outer membrane protein